MRSRIAGCLASACAAAWVAGCAVDVSDRAAGAMSLTAYDTYTCAALSRQASLVSAQALRASRRRDERFSSDAVAATAAVAVLWPTLFLWKRDAAATAELSQLSGQMSAIERASAQKSCGITFVRI